MRVPIEITYRNVAKRDGIEQLIHDKAEKLNDFHDGIVSCRISLEQDQESKRSVKQFHVRISLRVPPGKELVVHQKSSEQETGDTLRTVITDAFKTIGRQLKKLKQKQRAHAKIPPEILEPEMEEDSI
ncbi:MAG: ribosome-associated translation inhibitor RaiA [Desulfobacteraceae bacterium]|nr:ribosome-associated translation inhibitor RaiA [Desulfobacteraceae bacterium]